MPIWVSMWVSRWNGKCETESGRPLLIWLWTKLEWKWRGIELEPWCDQQNAYQIALAKYWQMKHSCNTIRSRLGPHFEMNQKSPVSPNETHKCLSWTPLYNQHSGRGAMDREFIGFPTNCTHSADILSNPNPCSKVFVNRTDSAKLVLEICLAMFAAQMQNAV